ncbi:carboxypeptidase M32 [Ideonella alba]|uniref:Metal-dependent carboxypeptidase n=1 Tax=Ideonella alba TaxID=2824118 RepID=A0A940YJN2_9BURK|nr:carboxypeptidase M32 [Ideonella alba]MBQ0931094.1 carboxypeptidase M32 [Ideonella alba]
MTSETSAYQALCAAFARIHRYEHLQGIVSWDQAAYMPPAGNEARAAALAELAALLHRLRTEPKIGHLLTQAEAEPLDAVQRANLREIRRHWLLATAWPEDLVERRALAGARCEHAWRSQRPANDWTGFAANLRPVLEIAREEARLLAERSGLGLYDALMDQYEPGMRAAEVARLFGEVRRWLPGLIQRVVARQADEPVIEPVGPFSVPAQRGLCEQVMRRLGFDFQAGRLDVSAHPFSGGAPEDVRLTTRFVEDNFVLALMGTIHETGHGRYEQGLPRAWLGQPIGAARSMALHESQSLSFEMQLGGHPGFARLLSPLLVEAFGDQSAFEPHNLHRLLTRVKPGLIRVEADEVTYPAHVILRFEIERALIEGEAEVDDIPAMWDERMQSLLGIDTRGNYRDGPMQDIHWTDGSFGYFPCYSLGAMYAAQWFAAMRRELPGLDTAIDAGDLSPALDWLAARIWSQASQWPTDELAQRASGETLNPAHFRAHLERRYLRD